VLELAFFEDETEDEEEDEGGEEGRGAVLQEREVMASPDVGPQKDPTEALEVEVEVEEEDRESDRIEEMEEETVSESTGPSRRARPRKVARRGRAGRKSTTRKRPRRAGAVSQGR